MKKYIAMFDKTHTFAKRFGKFDSETDILMTHSNFDDNLLTFLDPVKYPDKIKGVCKVVNMSDSIFFNIDDIDKFFGEMILLAHLSNKPGILYSSIYTRDDILAYIKQTNLATDSWRFMANDTSDSRIINSLLTPMVRETSGSMEIAIDQVFPVKGIGTVVLGFVTHGIVKVHDTVKLLPSGVFSEIRSIQIHDVDVKQAIAGDRVGLSLKNVSVDKIKDDFMMTGKDNNDWEIIKDDFNIHIYQDLIKQPMPQVVHLSYLLNDVTVRVVERNNEILKVRPDKPLVIKKDITGFVYDPNVIPRIIGKFSF
ncbi:hypothetical protein J7J90_01010 [Candidatus Micrarchaeota archaeon]|nr:hypothetical protein [Candidatus Micrarchaeota archaeon]